MSIAEFFRFTTERQGLIDKLEGARVRFAWYNTAGAQTKHCFNMGDVGDEELKRMSEDADKWIEENLASAESTLALLKEFSGALAGSFSAETVSVAEVEELFNTVKQCAEQWQKRTRDEERRRKAKADNVERFIQDDAKLLQWCRQEQSNLESLREPQHQLVFLESLQQSCARVEENLKVIWQMGTPLLPDREVEQALVEISEVWLYLQLFAFEQHQHHMYEIHPTAKLENEVKSFADFTTKLAAFLDSAPCPTDLQQQRADVKKGLAEHVNLPKQLNDFAGRMESIRENYRDFRQHVMARLTFISDNDSLPEERAKARQLEYAEKTAEITSWSKKTAAGPEPVETWEGLHGKVSGLREQILQQLNEVKAAKEANKKPPPEEVGEQF